MAKLKQSAGRPEPKTLQSDGFVKRLTTIDDAASCIEALRDLKYTLSCQRDDADGDSLKWFTQYHEGVFDGAIRLIANSIGHTAYDTAEELKRCDLVSRPVQP